MVSELIGTDERWPVSRVWREAWRAALRLSWSAGRAGMVSHRVDSRRSCSDPVCERRRTNQQMGYGESFYDVHGCHRAGTWEERLIGWLVEERALAGLVNCQAG
jgi:hypothetical protein